MNEEREVLSEKSVAGLSPLRVGVGFLWYSWNKHFWRPHGRIRNVENFISIELHPSVELEAEVVSRVSFPHGRRVQYSIRQVQYSSMQSISPLCVGIHMTVGHVGK